MDNLAWLQSAVPSKPHWAQLLKLISHLRGQLQAPNFDSCCLSSWKQLCNQLQELWATNQQLFNNFSLHMESSLYIIYISVLGVGWWGHLVCFCSLLSTNTDIFWIYQLPCTWEGDRRSRPSVDAIKGAPAVNVCWNVCLIRWWRMHSRETVSNWVKTWKDAMIRRRSNMEGCTEHLLDRHEYRCTFCPLVCLEIMQIVSPTPCVLPLQHGWEKLEDIQCSQVELKGNLSSLSDKISESSTSHRILYFKSQSIFLDLLTLTLVVKLSSHTKPVTNPLSWFYT